MRQLQTLKSALSKSRIIETKNSDIQEEEISVSIESFAFTSNNVTYGVAGDTIGYWQFFKTKEDIKNQNSKRANLIKIRNEPKITQNSKILIAGKNFGCGSSREHAPWALLDFGITCVISSSYADIFYNNCFKNGILPITISEEQIKQISEYSSRKEKILIDLKDQKIVFGNNEIKFELDEFKKKCLIEGLDDIALSLEKSDKIDSFEKKLKSSKPWIFND